ASFTAENPIPSDTPWSASPMTPSSSDKWSLLASTASATAMNMATRSWVEMVMAFPRKRGRAGSACAKHGAVARMVEQFCQFIVEADERDRHACHLQRRTIGADPVRMDIDAAAGKPLVHAPVDDVEFHQRRRSERIDQHRDLGPLLGRQFGEDAFEDIVGHLVGGAQRFAHDAGLAMDTHADFHFAEPDLEI